MSKSKHAKEDEFFKEKIRSLEKQNRQLRQRIKQLEHYPKEIKEKEYKKSRKEENICPECSKAVLQETDFVGRKFLICYLCKYRKKL